MPSKTCGAERARAHLPDLLDGRPPGGVHHHHQAWPSLCGLVPLAQSALLRKGPSLLKMKGSGAGLWVAVRRGPWQGCEMNGDESGPAYPGQRDGTP